MSTLSIQPTYPIFTDIDGQPLEDGFVWIGEANLDPQTNPINVYWDAALTIPAAQPIRTMAGYPSNSGTPARLYVNSDYSIRVMNKNGSVVYSAPAMTERYGTIINAVDVIYDPPFTGASQTNVAAKLSEIVSVKDFGAVGDGVTDDYAAISAAIATKKAVYFPSGSYSVSQSIILSNIGQRIFGASLGESGGDGVLISALSSFTGNATIEVIGGRNQVLENLFIVGRGANGATGVQIDALRLTYAPSFSMNNIVCKFGIAGVRHIRGNIQKWWNVFCEANDYGFVIEPDTTGGDCNGSTILGCRAYASYEWGWDIRQGSSSNGVMHSNFDISAEGGNNGIRIREGMYNQFKLYAESNAGDNFDTQTSKGNFVYVNNPNSSPSSAVQLLESSYNVGIYSGGANVYFDGGYAPERVIEREFSSVGGSLLNVGVRAYDITNTSGGTRGLTLGWLSYAPTGMRVIISKRDNTPGFTLSAPSGITLVGDTGTFGAYVPAGTVRFLEVFKLNSSTAICKIY